MTGERNNVELLPVSVVIATVGRLDALRRCLNALLESKTLPQEIIVVDQSGGCQIDDLLEGYKSAAARIVQIRQSGRGLSRARNAGLECATCPVIAVTDDDCVPGVGWVGIAHRELTGANSACAISGRVLPLGPESPGTYAVSSRRSEQPRVFRGRAMPWSFGTGGNFAVRREQLLEIRGYDIRLGAGSAGKAAEDMDIFYRLMRTGSTLRYEPAFVVCHERQNRERFLASRASYGFGIGAFCGIWLRRGDLFALRMLASWLALRLKLTARAILRAEWKTAAYEMQIVAATFPGLRYGFFA